MFYWLFTAAALIVLTPSTVLSQISTTTISDSSGRQTTATVSGNTLSLYDTQGQTAFGTFRDGYVYLQSSSGETTFGTIRNGQVFLINQTGNVTGTIRNGSIFLYKSDGTTTTGRYGSGYAFTTTTPSPEQTRQLQDAQQQQQQQLIQQRQTADQQNYAAGYQIGSLLGTLMVAGIVHHQVTKYCKANPTGEYVSGDMATPCPEFPLTWGQKEQAAIYCETHGRGKYIQFGRHRVYCD
jgi:hypothetical protein